MEWRTRMASYPDTLPAAYHRPIYAQKSSPLFEHVYESYLERDSGAYAGGTDRPTTGCSGRSAAQRTRAGRY